MRLVHLGYQAYFVGETVTPKIERGDMLVVVSGSGRTMTTQELVKLGKAEGATTYGVVGNMDSPVVEVLDHTVYLPGGSKEGRADDAQALQPFGSLFEQAAFTLLEIAVLALYQRQGSDFRTLLDRHANLE